MLLDAEDAATCAPSLEGVGGVPVGGMNQSIYLGWA